MDLVATAPKKGDIRDKVQRLRIKAETPEEIEYVTLMYQALLMKYFPERAKPSDEKMAAFLDGLSKFGRPTAQS